MAKMFLMEVDKEGREVEVNGLKDMYKFIECDCVDSQGLFSTPTGRVVVWLDDEGLLVNKKRNRGYAGNILVSKIDDEGEDIDLTSEDIEKIKLILDFKKSQISSNIIRTFIDNIDELIDEPILETFNYDDINLIVTVSSNDIINSFEMLKNKETIEMIENYIGSLYLGLINVDDFFHQLCESFAEAVYRETLENRFF